MNAASLLAAMADRMRLSPGRRRALLVGLYLVALGAAFLVARTIGAGGFGPDPGRATEESHRAALLEVRALRERSPQISAKIQEFADRTLGSTVEEVDGALRARLNRLGEGEGLRGLAVGTTQTTARESPAKSRYGRSGEVRRLRDEIDLVEVQAWISGDGTVQQVLQLLQRIDAEPWIKRIDGVRMEALGSDGARGERRPGEPRLRATIRLTALLVPGVAPKTQLASAWTPADAARLEPLVSGSLFWLPAPPAARQAAQPAPPPPPTVPAGFPYEQWRVTGIASTPTGPEVWLVNQQSGERRVLVRGESLHELVLAEARGESARFRAGEREVEVALGAALRAP